MEHSAPGRLTFEPEAALKNQRYFRNLGKTAPPRVNIMRKLLLCLLGAALLALPLAACGSKAGGTAPSEAPSQAAETAPTISGTAESAATLAVRFGNSAPFTLYLEDNDTAAAIARHVGTADWRLPIYHYDDYEGWESFQYYDIPSRYEIPSNAQAVVSEKAGEVYYSEPNRIVLFYHDGEISGEYTLVGHFEVTEEFTSAVENNPTLEGWGNKIVQISPGT